MSDATFDALAALLKARSGLVIGPDKLYLLDTRLGPIMKREGLRDLAALAARVRVAPTLEREVVEAMTTNESLFFRDGKPFQHVAQHLPVLHASRPPGTPLRFWSAAASSGQDAYSLAMLLVEQRALLGGRPLQIVGTDISREQMARARSGVYTQFEVQRGLPMQRLVRHFIKCQSNWQISAELRAMVDFREWNLLSDLSPLGSFDVVFCRNVLIYFDAPTKTVVLEAIARRMAPDGVLYLGGAETVIGLTNCFKPVDGQRGAYVKSSNPPATK
jgi:chemotaxis protein methyltransferase CheR